MHVLIHEQAHCCIAGEMVSAVQDNIRGFGFPMTAGEMQDVNAAREGGRLYCHKVKACAQKPPLTCTDATRLTKAELDAVNVQRKEAGAGVGGRMSVV